MGVLIAISRRVLTLTLALTPGIGAKTITRVLTRNDLLGRSCEDFFSLGPEALNEEYRLGEVKAKRLYELRDSLLQQASQLERNLAIMGVTAVTAADAHYPRQVELFDQNPPELLYLYGNAKLLNTKSFCVLSSRRSSESALIEIEKSTENLILRGLTLVSGHDTAEYQRSAVTALRWGAPRILVLDTGFYDALGDNLTDEPFPAARLWRYRFDPKTDLAISPISPFGKYHRNSNRIRDRLIGGLASVFHGIEIAPGGNMERLLKMALKAGRHVCISEFSSQAESLLKIGAEILPMQAR